MGTTPKIALTVIGGYLGAGKTTLLNHVLRDAGDRRLAVLVNDFGAINIDAELVQSRDGEMLTLSNGCICCGIGGDFIAALASLRDASQPPEQVVVEASGVADPTQIAVLGDMPGYVRDAVVVVVDAETVRARAGDEATGHQVRMQLRAADLLVINKTDLVAVDDVRELRAWLRALTGPSTSIVEAAFGVVPTDILLGVRTTEALARPRQRAPSRDRDPHDPEPPRIDPPPDNATRDEAARDDHAHDHGSHDDARDHGSHDHGSHDHGSHDHAHYETWSWTSATSVSGAGLVEALAALPDGIVRAKGLLALHEDPANRYLLQLVGRRYSVEAQRPWASGEPRTSRLVVIGLPGSVDASALDATMSRLSREPSAVPGGG